MKRSNPEFLRPFVGSRFFQLFNSLFFILNCQGSRGKGRQLFFYSNLPILAASPVFIGDWDREVRSRYLPINLPINLTIDLPVNKNQS